MKDSIFDEDFLGDYSFHDRRKALKHFASLTSDTSDVPFYIAYLFAQLVADKKIQIQLCDWGPENEDGFVLNRPLKKVKFTIIEMIENRIVLSPLSSKFDRDMTFEFTIKK